MNMKRNNLFQFATSELSQDAFICWLMNFASKKHQHEDLILSECAKEILSMFIQSKEDVVVTKISKQYKNIDVLIEVNDKYNIIIEDKTFTNIHDNQINTYKQTLTDEKRNNIICVYYKIIEQPFEEKNVVNVTRKDLINWFSKYVDRTSNIIFKDYYDYLLSIESSVNKYKTEPIKNWLHHNGHAYKGFFTHLIENRIVRLDRSYGWQYVANPSGGMQALWWYNLTQEELKRCNLSTEYLSNMYLQIENNIIAVKIKGNTEKSNSIRWSLYSYIKEQVPYFNKKTFRNGQWMTVGYIEYDEKNYREKIELMERVMESIANGDYKYNESMKVDLS